MLKFTVEEPALILKTADSNILIVPDLHLGFEKELSSRGINIPSQTERIYNRINSLVERYHPSKIIFLGDIKHGTSKILPHEWLDIPEFFERLLTHVKQIEIVPGNHDGNLKVLLPRDVKFHSTKGITMEDRDRIVALIHGHTWPDPDVLSSDILIMGHHHFTIEFRDSSGLRMVEPVWLISELDKYKIASAYLKSKGIVSKDPVQTFQQRFNYRVKSSKVIVTPTFNPLLGGRAVNRVSKEEYIGPIFRSGAIDLEDSEIYLLDGTYLGKLKDLKVD